MSSYGQFIFWTSKEPFILDYTAIHIWDKKTGCGSEYERIFERNGNKNFKVFRGECHRNFLINGYDCRFGISAPSQNSPSSLINFY